MLTGDSFLCTTGVVRMCFFVPCSSLELLVDSALRLTKAAFRLVRAAKSLAQKAACYRNTRLQDAAFKNAGCCPVAFHFEFLARLMFGDLRLETIRLRAELFEQELENGGFAVKCLGTE